jgi:hypothetical protein
MKRAGLIYMISILVVFAVGCSEQQTAVAPDDPVSPLSAPAAVVHRVTVGGSDLCQAFGLPPGCDANFSMVASELADGRVKGQWQDTWFGRGVAAVPIHVTIDCIKVVGNEAWVSGVVTGGVFNGVPVITRVVDNGTSQNDPPDQISFIFEDTFGGCEATPDLPLFDIDTGQVKVE